MEMQGIPMTIANLAIHRNREEEMNQERMRHNQMVQEATAQQAREANKVKAREVVPDFEEEEDSEELASSASEEFPLFLVGTIPTSPWYYLYDSVHLPRSERIKLEEFFNMKIVDIEFVFAKSPSLLQSDDYSSVSPLCILPSL
ncbi:hypothetical protein PIB30_018498 [Stylosanthes scabra]|uniref:Uncharacterized protein n=1 Tax=Stylosanthes scabra TaxID=79078 RepID=A0ABU6X6U8_9FABA|nr:hypothetical protein [Stylosanthes scabra]